MDGWITGSMEEWKWGYDFKGDAFPESDVSLLLAFKLYFSSFVDIFTFKFLWHYFIIYLNDDDDDDDDYYYYYYY